MAKETKLEIWSIEPDTLGWQGWRGGIFGHWLGEVSTLLKGMVLEGVWIKLALMIL